MLAITPLGSPDIVVVLNILMLCYYFIFFIRSIYSCCCGPCLRILKGIHYFVMWLFKLLAQSFKLLSLVHMVVAIFFKKVDYSLFCNLWDDWSCNVLSSVSESLYTKKESI